MFSLLTLILTGIFIAAVVYLTYKVWKNKINDKLRASRAKKVISSELRALEKECTNRASLNELDSLANEGYTHVMAAMDNRGNIIGDVELIKDTAHDSDVHALHNSTGEGVIVIED